MYKLEIKLKQHTPLIHFQHDQEGATLRASEVKPKLDRFILGKLSSEEKEQGQNDGWIKVKGDKTWLDYKMRIEANGFQDISIPVKKVKKNGILQTDEIGRQLFTTDNYPDNNASLIMSNIGGRAKEDVFNFSIASNIMATILLHDDKLQSLLKENLYLFFAKNSFGNRTSKGFGSFEVKSINGIEDAGTLYSDSYIISFTIKLSDEEEGEKKKVYKDVFKIIQSFWKSLKNISGVKGKSDRNVLLKVNPQRITDADRIPSPIIFKPLVDFYKENGQRRCDVNISILFDKDVIRKVTDISKINYYKDKIKELKNNLNIYDYLKKITDCNIDEQSVIIE